MILRLAPFLTVLCLLVSSTAFAAAPRNLSAEEARKLLASEPKVFLLDVRTPQEFRELRLPGARLLPVDQLQRRLGEIPTGSPVLVYCAVGARSSQAAGYLARRGYSVYNLVGGIYAWQLRGYPVVKGEP